MACIIQPDHSQVELSYALSADVIMADPYPIGRCEVAGGCDNVSAVVDATVATVALAKRATAVDGRPRSITMVPQAFGSLGSTWTRNPTRQEGRVMRWDTCANTHTGERRTKGRRRREGRKMKGRDTREKKEGRKGETQEEGGRGRNH